MPAPAASPVVRARGQHKGNAITCYLDVRSDWSYELCIVPHRDPSAAVIERFAALTPALLRQAEIAEYLRANGWTVIEHGAALSIHDAA